MRLTGLGRIGGILLCCLVGCHPGAADLKAPSKAHCSSRPARPDKTGWFDNVTRKILELEALAKEYDQYKKKPSLDNPGFGSADMIEMTCSDVWLLTNHCAFGDFEFSAVPDHVLLVAGRYRDFLRKNRDRDVVDIYRDGIEETIDLVPTRYYWIALTVLQNYVRFDRWLGLAEWKIAYAYADDQGVHRIGERQRREAYLALKDWFRNNQKFLKGNPQANRFSVNGTYKEFILPKKVIVSFSDPQLNRHPISVWQQPTTAPKVR